jgi:hypothetical protein
MHEELYLQCPPVHINKVQVIKSIRMLTNSGLLNSKLMSERLDRQLILVNRPPRCNVDDEIQILRSYGCIVSSPVNDIYNHLRQCVKDAMAVGMDELANEILQLLLAEKLRSPPLAHKGT